ncbi:MAG TPA: IS630 family transposase [Gammaproteobacteria bacterium]|nr:IS630 family transposase [Gammaproteobacteria bacterium]
MKYVLPLTNAEVITLQHLSKYHPQPQVRTRGNAILLSNNKIQLQHIADISNVCRQTVSIWFNHWETNGLCGLFDKSGRGRKSILREIKSQVIELVNKTPRSLTQVLAEIKKIYAIDMSKDTLKRFCRKSGLVWKRVRKSLCGKRDDKQFYAKLEEIGKLLERANKGELNLCYFDESGFTLEPCVPYAWQPISETIKVPSSHSKRLNVLGFISHACVFDAYVVEGSITSDVVIACIDNYVKTLTLDTVLIIDNAPIHTSSAFLENVEKWERKGLTILNIPAYSPELNKIEIVWRKIKYEWLDFSAYDSFQSLKNSLDHILANIGIKYQVNFS